MRRGEWWLWLAIAVFCVIGIVTIIRYAHYLRDDRPLVGEGIDAS